MKKEDICPHCGMGNSCEKCAYFNSIKRVLGFCMKNDHYTFNIDTCIDFKLKASIQLIKLAEEYNK